MANFQISVHANDARLEVRKGQSSVWVEITYGDESPSNVVIFFPIAMADRVEAACRAFNSEMDR